MKISKDRCPEKGDSDIDLEVIVNDLDHMGQLCRSAIVPPQHEARVVRALRERAAERSWQDTSRWLPRHLFARHRPLALAAAVVVSLVAIVGGAYATVSTLSRVSKMSGADNILTQNLGTHVNRSHTMAGYTVTVKRVYVDSNRVLIAYTIHPPATRKRQWNLAADNLKVTTASGVALPNRGYVNASEIGQPDATLQWFDAASVTGDPKELHLRLTVPWIDGMEHLPAPPTSQPSATGGPHGLPTSGLYGSIATDPANRPNGVQDPYMHDFRVFGPLSFDITVPFEGGREVDVHQQVRAGGTTLTLERVVISPTETRAYVSGFNSKQSHSVEGNLSGDGWTDEDIDGGSTGVWYSNGMTVFSYLGSFMNKHGAWTLTVKSTFTANETPNPVSGGPWTFHFTVP